MSRWMARSSTSSASAVAASLAAAAAVVSVVPMDRGRYVAPPRTATSGGPGPGSGERLAHHRVRLRAVGTDRDVARDRDALHRAAGARRHVDRHQVRGRTVVPEGDAVVLPPEAAGER